MKISGVINSIVSLLILNSDFAFAQGSSKTAEPPPQPREYTSRGVRFALLRPYLHNDARSVSSDANVRGDASLSPNIGLSVGYLSLPIMRPGWASHFAFMQVKDGDRMIEFWRLNGNLAFGFNRRFHIRGGLNLTQFTSGQFYRDLTPRFGSQIGGGFQLGQTFGVDLDFVVMKEGGWIDYGPPIGRQDVEFTQRGPEISLNATF